MPLITDTARLADFCARLSGEEFVAVDTEFIREKTYYPQVCLIQLAGENEARAVDALAPGLDLAPVYDLMRNPKMGQKSETKSGANGYYAAWIG